MTEPKGKINLSGNYLLIDAAGPKTQVGIWINDHFASLQSTDSKPLEGIFNATAVCMEEAGTDWPALNGFIYGKGPGSTLGLRLASMAIQTWKSVSQNPNLQCFSYSSLQIMANTMPEINNDALLLAPWKQGWFYGIKMEEGQVSGIEALSLESVESANKTTYLMEAGRMPKKLPSRINILPYSIPQDLAKSSLEAILTVNANCEPFQLGEQSYQKWSQERHRGQ